MRRLTCLLAFVLAAAAAEAQPRGPYMVVDDRAAGIPIQPTMYGIFFEDINFAADGGLYAEKICNRSFEYDNPLQGWKTFGKVEVPMRPRERRLVRHRPREGGAVPAHILGPHRRKARVHGPAGHPLRTFDPGGRPGDGHSGSGREGRQMDEI